MYVLYDVVRHKACEIGWNEKNLRVMRVDKPTRFIAELPSSYAEQIINDITKLPRSLFHEGIARYAQHHRTP